MGSPKFLKLLVVAALAAAAWLGVNYLRDNPEQLDIRQTRQQPHRLPGPPDSVLP